MKAALISAACLQYSKPSDHFILDTDASDVCAGAEHAQIKDDQEVVISYASNILIKDAKKGYTTCKELLALVKFTMHFHHYLLGRRFLIHTDHNSLVWLMELMNPEGQLA